jgi:hypothetical protein
MHEVREFAGHADIRTTELYFVRKEEDAEVAAHSDPRRGQEESLNSVGGQSPPRRRLRQYLAEKLEITIGTDKIHTEGVDQLTTDFDGQHQLPPSPAQKTTTYRFAPNIGQFGSSLWQMTSGFVGSMGRTISV